jgi:hypothetical protein
MRISKGKSIATFYHCGIFVGSSNWFLMEESELVGTVSSSPFCRVPFRVKGGLRGIFQ